MSNWTCPKCGSGNIREFKFPAPTLVHWVLNPGLAVNELILGQHIPKLMLICNDCPEPLYGRSYVPCPHCGVMHDGRAWNKKRFGNWLGLVCPACGERIPCLWNWTSLLILAITSPLWYLPYRFYFRDRQAVKPPPFTPPADTPKTLSPKVTLRMGLFYGGFMWLFMSVVPNIRAVATGHAISWFQILFGLIIWSFGGASFALSMKWYLSRKGKTSQPPAGG